VFPFNRTIIYLKKVNLKLLFKTGMVLIGLKHFWATVRKLVD